MPELITGGLDIKAIQEALTGEGIDGWLFYNFHGIDPLAKRILGLADGHFVSRRWFYLVPAKGDPIKLVHRIEMGTLDRLPGEKLVYLGWRELESQLKKMLTGCKRLAMQYSPANAIPYISRVDAGTFELVQSSGAQVCSSADLVQRFEATWSKSQLASHITAAENLRKIVFEAFARIRTAMETGEKLNEYDIQQFILNQFEGSGMMTNSPPIVAVNAHAASPHYQPTATEHSPITKGDFVLLDIWAKMVVPYDAVYADITWTGYVGEKVPERYTEIFNIVAGARDAATNFVKAAVSQGRQICGYEVDDVARAFIADRGYGDKFVHRTGHSIGTEVHGNGANIDNLETSDKRRLIPRTCFSIEPGIYLDDFGVRSEIDVYISDGDVVIAGQPMQTEVIPILVQA